MRSLSTPVLGWVVALGLAVTLAAQLPTRAANEADEPKPCLLLNLTSGKEDLHAVTMALQLAGHGLNDGRKVVLFLNVRAPEFADRELAADLRFRDNPPLKQMVADLVARGAQILVCPACAAVMDVSETELIPGAKFATRESLFGTLGPNTAVFTY